MIAGKSTVSTLLTGAALAVLLSGCVSTAASIITAPVRAAGQVVDWSTTSQDESDRNLGRKVRAREAELGRLERQRARAAERCRDGREDSCDQARDLEDQMTELRNAPLD